MDSNDAALLHAPLSRCRACQLQLCKSRTQEPHAALKEISRDEAKRITVYRCDSCEATLERSADLARPGWTQQR